MIALPPDTATAAAELGRLRTAHAMQRRELEKLRAETVRLRKQVEGLRAVNQQLTHENARLRASLDTYVARAQATHLFGPVEMTAGTHVGPRRPRTAEALNLVTTRDRGFPRHPHL